MVYDFVSDIEPSCLHVWLLTSTINSKHKYDYEYNKIVYGNCGLINEYMNELCCNKHFLRSSKDRV